MMARASQSRQLEQRVLDLLCIFSETDLQRYCILYELGYRNRQVNGNSGCCIAPGQRTLMAFVQIKYG